MATGIRADTEGTIAPIALEGVAGGGERGRDPGAVGVCGGPVEAAAHVDYLVFV
jgi:hypothetical protein